MCVYTFYVRQLPESHKDERNISELWQIERKNIILTFVL
jgi:hypothetical protein